MKKVFVNGTFDVLHESHLELLRYAKSVGDFLLVALDTDERIKEKKGNERPFNDLKTRCKVMSFLKPVDSVKYFNSDEELREIIKAYKPDIMIVGSDWKDKEVIGSEFAKELLFYERLTNDSSTNIINNFKDRIKKD